jgi:hypothetical protein
MDKLYTILVDHHKTYDIQGKGKYGLTITLAGVGIGTALPKELFSDAELRRALSRLGYESEGITDILEALTANKVSWKRSFGVGGGIRTHDSRSHSPEFYH